jgi:hypothetical protein
MWPAQWFSYCHQLKARESCYVAVILVCYVLQECYLKESCIFFQALSLCISNITGSHVCHVTSEFRKLDVQHWLYN